MTVIEYDWNRKNVEGAGIASTKTDDLKTMPTRLQPVPTKESLVSKLPTPISNMFHHALPQSLQVLGQVSVGENSQNDEFDQVKEEREGLLEDMKAYEIETEKLEKTLLEIKVGMKAMTWSVIDLERTMSLLETDKTLLMKKNEGLASCSSHTTRSDCQITEKFQKPISPSHIGLRLMGIRREDETIFTFCSVLRTPKIYAFYAVNRQY